MRRIGTDRVGSSRLDRLALTGLRAYGRHGVLPAERDLGQPFVVDLSLWLNAAHASASDELPDTVDYGALAQRVVALIEGDSVNLIETLAGRIAELCLAQPRVETVEVTVHKPHAPIPVTVGDVSVTTTRSRA